MPTPSLLQRLKERKVAEKAEESSNGGVEPSSPTKTFRSKLTALLRSGHVHVSMATGLSIIVMAYASKRVLPEPLSYLQLAFPPFLLTIYEALVSKKKYAKYAKSRYWVSAIILATLLVMGVKYF
jgi:hypothetical protein